MPIRTSGNPVVRPPANVTATALTALTGKLDFAKVGAAATAFMDKSEREEKAAIAADGVGLRYGEQSAYGKMNQAQRFAYIKGVVQQKHPEKANDTAYINGLMSRMKSTSCIGYTMEGLAVGYAAAGQTARWQQIQAAVRAKGTIGTVLMSELQKDGWEAVYWNADTGTYRGPTATPNDKQRAKDHAFFVSKFVSGGKFKPGLDASGQPIPGRDYYGTYPQRALTNFFSASAGQQPKADPTVLAHLKNVPYWVGVAASGYHTFPGVGGQVRDSHVARNPDDGTNIENRPFQDLDYAWDTAARKRKTTPSGDPVYSEEQSGIMLIPPGTWS